MEQWITGFKEIGLPALVILALAWVVRELFGKYLWPLITRRLEDADRRLEESAKRFEEQGKTFAESLKFLREETSKRFEEQGRLFAESMRTSGVFAAESHREITQELRAIHERLRNGQ